MEEKLKALLVDDEPHAIDLLKKVLGLFEHNIEVTGEAATLPQALQLIHTTKPDVVFLDIEMPKYSGLQIHDFLDEEHPFRIIYVTAHEEYAIEALRAQAFDYLLKPIDIEQLKKCIERLNRRKAIPEQGVFQERGHKITINSHQGVNYVDVNTVNFIEASSMYSVIHTDNDRILVSRPLKDFEYLLQHLFYRVHRSYIVNLKKVVRFSSHDGGEVELADGTRVAVANAKREDFKQYMQLKFGMK